MAWTMGTERTFVPDLIINACYSDDKRSHENQECLCNVWLRREVFPKENVWRCPLGIQMHLMNV